ncbi:hypothetical protein AAC387_Pa06g0332 [Persea americana]
MKLKHSSSKNLNNSQTRPIHGYEPLRHDEFQNLRCRPHLRPQGIAFELERDDLSGAVNVALDEMPAHLSQRLEGSL